MTDCGDVRAPIGKKYLGRRLAEARWGFATPGLSGRYRGFLKLGSKKLI